MTALRAVAGGRSTARTAREAAASGAGVGERGGRRRLDLDAAAGEPAEPSATSVAAVVAVPLPTALGGVAPLEALCMSPPSEDAWVGVDDAAARIVLAAGVADDVARVPVSAAGVSDDVAGVSASASRVTDDLSRVPVLAARVTGDVSCVSSPAAGVAGAPFDRLSVLAAGAADAAARSSGSAAGTAGTYVALASVPAAGAAGVAGAAAPTASGRPLGLLPPTPTRFSPVSDDASSGVVVGVIALARTVIPRGCCLRTAGAAAMLADGAGNVLAGVAALDPKKRSIFESHHTGEGAHRRFWHS